MGEYCSVCKVGETALVGTIIFLAVVVFGFYLFFNYYSSDNEKPHKPRNQSDPRLQEYRWICGPCMSEGLRQFLKEEEYEGDFSSDICPDCRPRQGRIETMELWELIGEPRSGFSMCGTDCTCRLVPVDD